MGPVIFILGVLLAAGGVALAYLDTPPLPLPDGVSEDLVMLGALGVGGGLTVLGAVLWIFSSGRKPGATTGERSVDVDAAMMLRAMFSVAAADGELGEAEIEMIGLVTGKILGRRMHRRDIKAAFDEFIRLGEASFHNPGFDDAPAVLTPDGAYAALKAATLVAFSDGDFQTTERSNLAGLAQRLGLAPDRLEACIAEARAAYGDVAGAPPQGA